MCSESKNQNNFSSLIMKEEKTFTWKLNLKKGKARRMLRRKSSPFFAALFIAALTAPTVGAFKGALSLCSCDQNAVFPHRWKDRRPLWRYSCSSRSVMYMNTSQNEPHFMWKRRHAKSVFEGIRGISLRSGQSQGSSNLSPSHSTVASQEDPGQMERLVSLSTLVQQAQEETTRQNWNDGVISSAMNVFSLSAHSPSDVSNQMIKNGHTAANENLMSKPQALTETSTTTVSSPLEHGLSPQPDSEAGKRRKRSQREYVGRTMAGLIAALAEEALDLKVEVHAKHRSPLWKKTVDSIKISFSKLGFKPLRIRGVEVLSETVKDWESGLHGSEKRDYARNLQTASMVEGGSDGYGFENLFGFGKNNDGMNAEEAFRQMDTDNSGTLDQEELVAALNMAVSDHQETDVYTRTPLVESIPARSYRFVEPGTPDPTWAASRTEAVLERLAARLVQLYDLNGNGVVDQSEYLTMVQDMAELRRSKRDKLLLKVKRRFGKGYMRNFIISWLSNYFLRWGGDEKSSKNESLKYQPDSEESLEVLEVDDVPVVDQPDDALDLDNEEIFKHSASIKIPKYDPLLVGSQTGEGSILIENLKLDLRRLVFGAVPILKKVIPGGPLILEPFNVTVTGSFNKDDIMESVLLQAGLNRLVARALRRRVRSFRDLVDGAHFFGRTWTLASKEAPQVDLPNITNVEFDEQDRMIITGRARLRTSLTAPEINNAFKLRTKFGTRENGRIIRLEEPELALVLECPRSVERNIVMVCQALGLPIPERPKPIYSYFPLVSPVKVTDKDGFDLGEDNRIRSIQIKNGALRFEICSALRPGRFLGNHYLAFSVPNRTFIITLDRVYEGIRAARRNKRLLRLSKKNSSQSNALETKKYPLASTTESDFRFQEAENTKGLIAPLPTASPPSSKESFFSRFVRGYMGSSNAATEEREEELNERLTLALSEWFGRQTVHQNYGRIEKVATTKLGGNVTYHY